MFSRSPGQDQPPSTASSATAATREDPQAGPAATAPNPNSNEGRGHDPFQPASKLTASTIGTDLTILGEKITIISQYLLQIDGDVRADINGKKVLIGQEGSVIGTVTAESVEIHGGLRGAVKAKSVALQPTAKVEGDIHHETLAIAEGAEFDGSVKRPKDAASITPDLDPANHQNGKGGPVTSRSSS